MNKEKLDKLIESLAARSDGKEMANEPSLSQLKALADLKVSGPFHFINLLKFKELAEYPASHPLAEKQLSGEAAYNKYGFVALDHVTKRGGRLMTSNNVEMQLLGISAGWDKAATMEYRNLEAFIDMVSDSEYQDNLVHRDAGLLDSELFVTRPQIGKPVGRFKFGMLKLVKRLRR